MIPEITCGIDRGPPDTCIRIWQFCEKALRFLWWEALLSCTPGHDLIIKALLFRLSFYIVTKSRTRMLTILSVFGYPVLRGDQGCHRHVQLHQNVWNEQTGVWPWMSETCPWDSQEGLPVFASNVCGRSGKLASDQYASWNIMVQSEVVLKSSCKYSRRSLS